MFDLLSRAERRAAKALAVFESATADLKKANAHLAAVKQQAKARIERVTARGEAEVARIQAHVSGEVERLRDRHAAAAASQQQNHSIISKIENLLS